MKKVLLFFVFLLLLPIAFAEINIQTDQGIYNVGDKIKVYASVLSENNFDGLFKLGISCGEYSLQYFTTPINLEANFRTAANVPDLPASLQMLGNCTVSGQLVTNQNLAVDQSSSKDFGITNKLSIFPVKTTITALPGDTIMVSGVINEAFGNNVLKASAKAVLDENSYSMDAIDGKFNTTIELVKKIKSGRHTIGISAVDASGNVADYPMDLEVTAIPTYIKIELSSDHVLPGSKIEIVSSIYDQADDLINDSLSLDLDSFSKDNIFKKTVFSHEKLEYEISQYAPPGLYELSGYYKDLNTKSYVNVSLVRSVNVKYVNETVFVENVGNVPFEDELTFFLETQSKKYPIIKKISIEPGKILNIDLSREVPLGIYNITLPLKEGFLKDSINDTIQALVGEKNLDVLASGVMIHDNRPVYKKIASGLSSISGNLIGSDGLLSNNPLIAPGILVGLVLIITFRYGRKPLMRVFHRREESREEEKKHP